MAISENVQKEYRTIQETEPTAQGSVLSMLSGGEPYVFIVPRITGEHDETLFLELATNIPGSEAHILRTVLEAVLATLPEDEELEVNSEE